MQAAKLEATNGRSRRRNDPRILAGTDATDKSPVWRGVVGVVGTTQPSGPVLIWNEDAIPSLNYAKLGKRLAEAGDLFRSPKAGGGLIRLLPTGKHVSITKGSDLLPVIVDRVPVRVQKEGESRGSKLDAAHLNAMVQSEVFLGHFLPVDQITTIPMYLPGFVLTKPVRRTPLSRPKNVFY